MTLGERIPDTGRKFDRSNAITLFWFALFAFLGALAIFLLLQRLGLPTEVVVFAIATFGIIAIVGLSWISRTMNSPLFFFANRALGAFTSGLGSTTDLLSGAMLVLFFSTHLAGKMVIASGLVLGILLQAALFSAAIQRSAVSNVPGFFTWRFQRKIVGYPALLVTFAVLLLFAMAEFQVAKNILHVQTGLPLEQTALIIAILAVLPSLFGGWTGLLLVNATLTIWILVCTLVPAAATGFFAHILGRELELGFLRSPLESLELLPLTILFGPDGDPSGLTIIVSVLAIAMGASTLPHSLSRLSTNSREVEAIESVGWLALMVFLMFSALPLSVGLIIAPPTSDNLAAILQSQPVLQMLPYFVILFAALNALAATLFAAASSMVRASSRLRNVNPAERSVFVTRLCVLLFAAMLVKWPEALTPSPEHLLVGALMVCAGGLFVPLAAGAWLASVSARSASAAIGAGAAIAALMLIPIPHVPPIPAVWAGTAGALVALAILAREQFLLAKNKEQKEINSSVQALRHH